MAKVYYVQITRKKSKTDLQNQRDELRKRITEKKKQLAAVIKSPDTTVHSEKVEDDTARALSWMLANVERMMSEKTSQPIVDAVPAEKIDDDADTVGH
ncbi:hypothetical protein GCK32_012574 [Trichostrongylus colubriformis]|uniref:Uncharacterized protein n=1 Tax=Trichostrongylus colubriformis TaxID=6319 RepID=A0AAN8FLK4_TRICO